MVEGWETVRIACGKPWREEQHGGRVVDSLLFFFRATPWLSFHVAPRSVRPCFVLAPPVANQIEQEPRHKQRLERWNDGVTLH